MPFTKHVQKWKLHSWIFLLDLVSDSCYLVYTSPYPASFLCWNTLESGVWLAPRCNGICSLSPWVIGPNLGHNSSIWKQLMYCLWPCLRQKPLLTAGCSFLWKASTRKGRKEWETGSWKKLPVSQSPWEWLWRSPLQEKLWCFMAWRLCYAICGHSHRECYVCKIPFSTCKVSDTPKRQKFQ